MCIVVPAKRGQSQDTARQLYVMREKMVVLPILFLTALIYSRGVPEPGTGKVEGAGKEGRVS